MSQTFRYGLACIVLASGTAAAFYFGTDPQNTTRDAASAAIAQAADPAASRTPTGNALASSSQSRHGDDIIGAASKTGPVSSPPVEAREAPPGMPPLLGRLGDDEAVEPSAGDGPGSDLALEDAEIELGLKPVDEPAASPKIVPARSSDCQPFERTAPATPNVVPVNPPRVGTQPSPIRYAAPVRYAPVESICCPPVTWYGPPPACW